MKSTQRRDLLRLTKAQLIRKCKQNNLSSFGTKNEMVDRLALLSSSKKKNIKGKSNKIKKGSHKCTPHINADLQSASENIGPILRQKSIRRQRLFVCAKSIETHCLEHRV